MTQAEELARYKRGWQDAAEYSPYTGTREKAREMLDLTKPYNSPPPRKTTGK